MQSLLKDALEEQQKAKDHKYKAKPLRIDGLFYASTGEAKRHQELLILERAGEIYGLLFQKLIFELVVNGILITKYKPDFVYYTKEGYRIIEDYKGFKTDEYIIKKNLMKALYGIDILETTN